MPYPLVKKGVDKGTDEWFVWRRVLDNKVDFKVNFESGVTQIYILAGIIILYIESSLWVF